MRMAGVHVRTVGRLHSTAPARAHDTSFEHVTWVRHFHFVTQFLVSRYGLAVWCRDTIFDVVIGIGLLGSRHNFWCRDQAWAWQGGLVLHHGIGVATWLALLSVATQPLVLRLARRAGHVTTKRSSNVRARVAHDDRAKLVSRHARPVRPTAHAVRVHCAHDPPATVHC